MARRSDVHVLLPVQVPVWNAKLGRVGDGLLYFAELAFCQEPDADVGVYVQRLDQYLRIIVTYAFNLAEGDNQLFAAFNVLSGDSEYILVL